MVSAEQLLARRQATIDDFKDKEKHKEIPWSPDHPIMQQAMRSKDKGGDGAKLGSERPVAIRDNTNRRYGGTHIYYCGPDVAVIIGAMKKYVANNPDVEALPEHAHRYACVRCEELLAEFESSQQSGTTPVLKLSLSDFNHVGIALMEVNELVVSVDLIVK
jgi:hypothetical protein